MVPIVTVVGEVKLYPPAVLALSTAAMKLVEVMAAAAELSSADDRRLDATVKLNDTAARLPCRVHIVHACRACHTHSRTACC